MWHFRVHQREIGKEVSQLCRTWELAAQAFQVVYVEERQKPEEEEVGYCEPQIT